MVYCFTVVVMLLTAYTGTAQIHSSYEHRPEEVSLNVSPMFYPVDGVVVSGHHYRNGRFHHGLDISHNNRDTVKSCWLGRVRYAKQGYNGGYGYLVIVTNLNGLETYYAHLREILVEEGDWIGQGHPVGIVGNTGNSLGPHLHFEVRYRGLSLNPDDVIDKTIINLKRHGNIYRVTK